MRTRHWGTWFAANVMAAVPFGTHIMTQTMLGHSVTIETEATRELLFYAVSASGIALVALNEAADSLGTRLCAFLALALTIASSVAYGEFLTGDALRAAEKLVNAYHLSIRFAIGALVLSAGAEVLTHRRVRS